MKIKPEDVHYLAFEGGGGKGVTYLGAIMALEDLKVLPIDIDKPEKNQIKGISGASAGAITALLLGLGYTSADMGNLLSEPKIFNDFFDKPDKLGRYRSVSRKNLSDSIEFTYYQKQVEEEKKKLIRAFLVLAGVHSARAPVETALVALGIDR